MAPAGSAEGAGEREREGGREGEGERQKKLRDGREGEKFSENLGEFEEKICLRRPVFHYSR